MSQDAKTKRVVVIGAGASGIGAARTLSAAGAEVIILEGRDRIGGRMRKHCLTKNLSKSSGLEAGADHFVNIQLGANWIHGMEAATNPMFEVAQKLGLELHQTSSDDDPGDDVILFDSGDFKLAAASDSDKLPSVGYSRVSKEDYHESLSRYEWIKEYVDHIQFNYEKEDISLQAAFDLALQASESEIFGPCSAPQRRCLNWMYDRVSIDLGAHISKVSLNCYAEGVSDGQGGEALVKHIGYSGILDYLAREFPLDIRLNRQVASIAVCNAAPSECGEMSIFETTTDEELALVKSELDKCVLKDGHFVRVTCTDGEVLVCDACVVTVPVGALQAQSISFVPRAPSVITSVCASLKLGLMNLVWLWYPYVFWPEECNFLGVARDRDGGVSAESGVGGGVSGEGEDNTVVKFSTFLVPPVFDNHGVRQPVLMCQIVGPYATTIESMSDADIAAEATATLRRMFGAQAHVPDALGCAHSSWGSDPNARGSWSYFPYRPAAETTVVGSVGGVGVGGVGVSGVVVGGVGTTVNEGVVSEGVHEGVFEVEHRGVQVGCGEQASVGTGVGRVVTYPINTSTALAQAPQLPAHTTAGAANSNVVYTTSTDTITTNTSTANPVYATTTNASTTGTTGATSQYESSDVASTTSGTSSPTTGPTTTTTAGGLSPLSHPSSLTVMHGATSTTTTTTTTTTTANTTAMRAAIKGRSLHSPLRSVTISEAAALVVPHTRATHTRYYSSTGYTSEGDVSTDSDDSDSSDDEYDEFGEYTHMNTPHSTRTTHFDLTASSSDEGVLRRSEDDVLSSHVCYASEAMSVLNRGTVHGAYLSGIREANKILAFLEERK